MTTSKEKDTSVAMGEFPNQFTRNKLMIKKKFPIDLSVFCLKIMLKYISCGWVLSKSANFHSEP